MNPITCATMHLFCHICLQSIEGNESKCKNIEEDATLAKWTQQILSISMQSIYSEAAKDTKQKLICTICFIKIQGFFNFYEKCFCNEKALETLLEEDCDSLTKEQLNKLKQFCRSCLKRQNDTTEMHDVLNLKQWLIECTGLTYDNDEHLLPETICKLCYQKLRGFIEFQQLAKESFKDLKDVLDMEAIEDGANENRMIGAVKEEVIESIFILETNVKAITPKEIVERDQVQVKPVSHGVEESDINYYENEKRAEGISNTIKDEHFSDEDYSDETTSSINFEAEQHKKKQVAESFLHVILEEDVNNDGVNIEINPETSICASPASVDSEIKSKTKRKTNSKSNNEKNYYKCDECDKKFFKKNRFEDHMEVMHKGASKMRQCSLCSNTFTSIVGLERHIKVYHDPLNAKSFSCTYCSTTLTNKSSLNAHIRAVHLKERPFKCKTCEKTFFKANALRNHELTHTADFPFVCEICKCSFRIQSRLNRHMQRHTVDPKLMCRICSRAKKSVEELNAHITKYHMKKQCFKCGKTFSKQTHMRDHDMAVHLKLRPVSCEICQKSFSTKSALRKHVKSHTEKKITEPQQDGQFEG